MIFVDNKRVEFTQYPNGETVVPVLSKPAAWARRDVRLAWESDQDLVNLALVRGYLEQLVGPHSGWTPPRLFIDYMPYSRMDRAQDDHCFSLLHIARLIESLRWSEITVVEPHSEQTRYLLGRDAKEIFPTARLLPKVMEMTDFARDTDYIVLPDAGALDRYSVLAKDVLDECNIIVMEKIRDFDTGRIQGLKVGSRQVRGSGAEPRGERGLIIDDLSSRGGTFIQTAKVLRESGFCSSVNLLVTHMESVGYTGELSTNLDRVFCTDTMPVPHLIPHNFHIFARTDWL